MMRQDTHLGGEGSDIERKHESTPSPSKQPPTGSKKSVSRGEVGFKNLAMNLYII